MPSKTNGAISEVLYDWARFAADDAGLPCIIAGGPKLPATAPIYCEFWYRLGEPRLVEIIDHPWRKTPGLLQFTIHASEETRTQTVNAKAKCIKEIFDREMWVVGSLLIETEKMGIVSLPGAHYGKRITVIDGGFDSYEAVM